jgi:uncharacterized protein (TIGR04255 family)
MSLNYPNPPIVQRLLRLTTKIPEERFVMRFETFRPLLLAEYPDYDPIRNWNINIEEKNGIPQFNNVTQELELTHRFWKLNERGQRLFSLAVTRTEFAIALLRSPDGAAHHFEQLQREAERWLALWWEHFQVENVEMISVEYTNLLSPDVTPTFVGPNGSLKIGEMLTIFNQMPGPGARLIPPYDCQLSVSMGGEQGRCASLRVLGLQRQPEGPKGAAARVDFQAWTSRPNTPLTREQCREELTALHDLILQHFEATFTTAAKESFKRLPSP